MRCTDGPRQRINPADASDGLISRRRRHAELGTGLINIEPAARHAGLIGWELARKQGGPPRGSRLTYAVTRAVGAFLFSVRSLRLVLCFSSGRGRGMIHFAVITSPRVKISRPVNALAVFCCEFPTCCERLPSRGSRIRCIGAF